MGGGVETTAGFDKLTDEGNTAGGFSADEGGGVILTGAAAGGVAAVVFVAEFLFCWCNCNVDPIRPDENFEGGECRGPF
jgi:hypothetical protein